jgi:hypothetical protein
MRSASWIGSAERADVRRGLRLVLVLLAVVGGRIVDAAEPEAPPDAQLLLDLDLLSDTKPQERDLMRRLSVVERWRLLDTMRLLQATPAALPPPPPPAPARPAGPPVTDTGDRR